MTEAKRIDPRVNRAIERYIAAIGGPDHRAAAEHLDDELVRLTAEAEADPAPCGCYLLDYISLAALKALEATATPRAVPGPSPDHPTPTTEND